MKEQVFMATKRRIINQTFFIWLWILSQLVTNIWFIPLALNENKIGLFILANVFLGFFTVPGIIIFYRYYKQSINKKVVITYNSIKLEDEKTMKVIELKNHEVIEIQLVTNSYTSKLPWTFMEYFTLTDINGNKIVITSFIMQLQEFWSSTLTRKVSNKNFVRKEVTYPIFQPANKN